MKMYTKLKYLPIAAVAAVALSLAGCGGGDDDPVATSSTPPTMEPTGPEAPALTTEAALTAAQDALDAAMAALTALQAKEDPAATRVEIAMAEDAVEAAMMARDAAEVLHTAYVYALPENVAARAAACEGTAACLAEAMMTLADARAALSALEASQDSTLGQVTAAKAAVTAAVTALAAAQTAHDVYLAMQPPYVPSVTELFVAAQAASDAATDAGDAATKAVKDAMDASVKLSTMSVNGDSMAATTNAQDVLDAQAAAAQAFIDAKAALDDAMAAKVHADALADDDASKDGLVAALDAAIVVAEAQLKIATDASEGDELEAAVAEVTGDDEEKPMSPADHGKTVAMAIGQALGGGEATAAALPRQDPGTRYCHRRTCHYGQ